MNLLDWLNSWLQNDDTKIIYWLMCILIANMIDFSIGWINAKFNKNISFSSNKAIYGIARKMMLFILCIFFVPVSLLIPNGIGLVSLYVLFTGYLFSEVTSILHHFKLADDDKTTESFIDFIQKLFNKNGG